MWLSTKCSPVSETFRFYEFYIVTWFYIMTEVYSSNLQVQVDRRVLPLSDVKKNREIRSNREIRNPSQLSFYKTSCGHEEAFLLIWDGLKSDFVLIPLVRSSSDLLTVCTHGGPSVSSVWLEYCHLPKDSESSEDSGQDYCFESVFSPL
ncbi:hypothetical protein LOAG_04079 [Loa loa]|uniref:Uncharacterized protein n=1 Tax=Loa loa TaxID=7209 RepID=A0A1S0U2X8_LOALO|nr:hypothetical protein LOAG_04079 [Loa loa]EFO24409.1 hypothetical protein LOAG_04079 [Loa loa]